MTGVDTAAPAKAAAAAVSTPVRRWFATAVLIGIGSLAAALVRGGALAVAQPGLPDAGPVTAWGLPAATLGAVAAAAVTIGFLLAAAVLLPPDDADLVARSGLIARRAASAWAVLSVLELAFTQSDILGRPLFAALGTDPGHYLGEFPQEQALAAQAVLAAAVAMAARRGTAALLLAVTALLPTLATGHSGTAPHLVAVPSLVVHVVAATVWAGGLAAVCWLARVGKKPPAAAARRFSTVALVCFAATGASGAVNAVARLGRWSDLAGTPYGQILAAKTISLLILGWCGRRHRTRTLPQLDGSGGRSAFVRLACVEGLVLVAAFALAVGLSRTAAPG